MVADGAGSIAIGAHAEEVLAAHLEHVGDLLENSCDLFVLHRGILASADGQHWP
jgi:hypothetical protein